jgi:hypothetical protein
MNLVPIPAPPVADPLDAIGYAPHQPVCPRCGAPVWWTDPATGLHRWECGSRDLSLEYNDLWQHPICRVRELEMVTQCLQDQLSRCRRKLAQLQEQILLEAEPPKTH